MQKSTTSLEAGPSGPSLNPYLLNPLRQKLNPRHYPMMSAKMGAIVGCILGFECTTPALVAMVVTTDGVVLGRMADDCGFNHVIGLLSELEDNWQRLLACAGLTTGEAYTAWVAYHRAVRPA